MESPSGRSSMEELQAPLERPLHKRHRPDEPSLDEPAAANPEPVPPARGRIIVIELG